MREFASRCRSASRSASPARSLLLPLLRRVALPNEALYPLRARGSPASSTAPHRVAHGSGFLAVFIAGLAPRRRARPYKGEIERFHTSLASLAEIIVFVALGLTIDLGGLPGRSSGSTGSCSP